MARVARNAFKDGKRPIVRAKMWELRNAVTALRFYNEVERRGMLD